ncbi:glycosyltransferase [Longilinea arvoryzae]|uniref:Glycosyltransferase n=1 Tax=Longilinea arvoryzae TaxID=360412 RepID=A0A0S7BG61_9CHLR|nr:glycosyltransferase family 2 protein [Longilinea arvoryzae]GAP13478.1 glycosyltransferase [Longilinea arvoryzae]
MTLISIILLALFFIPTLYLLAMALAAIRPAPAVRWHDRQPRTRFAIAIPAHNEETVIAGTVQRLMALDYPFDRFRIHIVADHCTDQTALLARQAGAEAHERNEGPRSGKGAALSWLFGRILQDDQVDALVIFDADTRVDASFLRVMDARLTDGAQVVQGQHRISNPKSGWFPALTWAMFLIDNRFQNLGRSNLGWSAKHMGDSICFRADVLRRLGWGEGLTEDYQLRQRLLLEGIHIVYEPAALGLGEAPLTWQQARAQRARWLRGTHDASRQFAGQLLREALKRGDGALLDGALQAYLPSYSTLTLLAVLLLVVQLVLLGLGGTIAAGARIGWAALVGLLYVYPLFGLVLERAPLRAYAAILTGPVFMLWRSGLALQARLGRRPVTWVRTAHGGSEKGK